MQPEQHQRIMGYFLEEAKEHLATIEQGLLNLQNLVEDSERLNEVFRAAHSLKGGAAMLGIPSIQKIAHQLEDCFKILQEHPLQTDPTLEALFFQGFDPLSELLEALESTTGLTEEVAAKCLRAVEPTFAQLKAHLEALLTQIPAALSSIDSLSTFAPPSHPLRAFEQQVTAHLRTMLRLFQQADHPRNRQQLEASCQDLAELGLQYEILGWTELLETARRAVTNPDHTYRTLAPILIQEIKQAKDQVLAGRATEITTAALQGLVAPEATAAAGEFNPETSSDQTFGSEVLLDQLADLLGLAPSATEPTANLEPVVKDPADLAQSLEDDSLDLDRLWEDWAEDTPTEDRQAERQTHPSLDSTEVLDTIDQVLSELEATAGTAQSLDLNALSQDVAADLPATSEPDLIDSGLVNPELEIFDLSTQEPDEALDALEAGASGEIVSEPALEPDILEAEAVSLAAESASESTGPDELEPEADLLRHLDQPLDQGISEMADTTEPAESAPEQLEPAAVQLPTNPEFEALAQLLESEQALEATAANQSLWADLATSYQSKEGLSNQTLRVPIKNLDLLSNLVGELVVNRNSLEQNQQRFHQFLSNLLTQVQQLDSLSQQMQDFYDRSLLENSLLDSPRPPASNPARPVEPPETSDPSNPGFDALEMDRFTAFHTLSQEIIERLVRVREATSDIEFVADETDQITRNFRQVTTQLQVGLTRARMVPFAQIADRLPRAVRDLSLQFGKQVDLEIEGRDTLVDKGILEHLYDPMTHLVNNALTHGIESPEVREAAGKPLTGKLTIQALHQGNQTVISVSDDGRGVNLEQVKAKAIQQGLVEEAEAETIADLEIYKLLFRPGFSTLDEATELAGRGIGMDVVQASLRSIQGIVSVDSAPDQGTTITIRVPLTLSICKALNCVDAHRRIAFPMDGVEDTLEIPVDQVQVNAEGSFISWRGSLLPLKQLSQLLVYNRSLSHGSVYGSSQEAKELSVVVLRSTDDVIAVQVDQVLGEQEIVIKQLQGPVPKPLGIAGVTILGDGRVMPIADVLELVDLSLGRLEATQYAAAGTPMIQEPTPKPNPLVLIVDDSITVRELLSMTFSKFGYRVEQARDGQEAWEKLRSGLACDLVFCDIEMPKMDGFELLTQIQGEPTLSNLPIAMLTSRGSDRHRQLAARLGAKGYFSKPYIEEALLEASQRLLKGETLIE